MRTEALVIDQLIEALENAKENFEAMIDNVKQKAELTRQSIAPDTGPTAAEMEEELFADMLELLCEVFGIGLMLADPGWERETIRHNGKLFIRNRRREKTLRTLFGVCRYQRWVFYAEDGTSLAPLEMACNLPTRQASYPVQELLLDWDADVPFERAVEYFNSVFGQSLSTKTAKALVEAAKEAAVAFESERPAPPSDEEKPILAASADGRGVPMRPGEHNAEAGGCKKQAWVGLTYSTDIKERDTHQLAAVMAGLDQVNAFSDILEDSDSQSLADGPWQPRYLVRLSEKEGLMRDLARDIAKRRKPGQPLVMLLDGDPYLEEIARRHLPEDTIYILDFVHLSGYLKVAAGAIAADDELKRLLHYMLVKKICAGNAGSTVDFLRAKITDLDLTGDAKDDVESCITYIENHSHMLAYDDYLAAGYPIATGVVESACGHIIADRFDIAGARWTTTGAQALLHLRAIRQSQQSPAFHSFRRHYEANRLYGQAA